MAILNPLPRSPTRLSRATRQLSNRKVASGWGAIRSMRSVTSNPGVSASTTKQLSPLAPGTFSGSCKNSVEIGNAAVGDPGFDAVQHEAVAFLSCGGRQGSHIRAGLRLGQGKGGKLCAAASRHQVALLLLRRSEQRERTTAEALDGESKISQGVIAAEDFANQAKAAYIQLLQNSAAAGRCRVPGPAGVAQSPHQSRGRCRQDPRVRRLSVRNICEAAQASISCASLRCRASKNGHCKNVLSTIGKSC